MRPTLFLVLVLATPLSLRAQLARQDWGKLVGEHRIHAKAEYLEQKRQTV